jgi:hypothetical protein
MQAMSMMQLSAIPLHCLDGGAFGDAHVVKASPTQLRVRPDPN